MSNKKKVPSQKEEYKIKYVFNEESNLDINDVIKECFFMKLKSQNFSKNHPVM